MRILLDECVNPRVKQAFPEYEVRTVQEMGWGGVTNGRLIALAREVFDVFVTFDQNLQYQQNLASVELGFIVVIVPDNSIRFLKPIFPDLLAAATAVRPGKVMCVTSRQA